MIRHTIISYSCVYIFIVILVTWILGISVTHAYMASLSSFHMDPCAYTCIIVPCYPVWLFHVTDMDTPVTGHESCWYAICGIPHRLLYCSHYIVPVLLFPFPVILFYAINRALVQLSCYPYHVLYVFLLQCILDISDHKANLGMGETWRLTRSCQVDVWIHY